MRWHPKFEFPVELKSANSKDKNHYFTHGFLAKHKHMEECRNKIIQRLYKFQKYQIINVVGPTGIGKTALAQDIVQFCYKNFPVLDEDNGIPALFLEVPSLKGNKIKWANLYKAFLAQFTEFEYGLHRSVRDPIGAGKGRTYSGKYMDADELENLFINILNDIGAKIIILDEIQHLFAFPLREVSKVLDNLKSISNRSSCQIILVGTYESLSNMSWNGALLRRTYDVNFRRYRWDDESERKDFFIAYNTLLANVPYMLDEQLLSTQNIREVYINCCGCIGILKQNIEKALEELSEDDSLTVGGLLAQALTTNKLERLAMEIKEGEQYFHDDGDRNNVAAMLGVNNSSNNTCKRVVRAKSKRKPRVGRRNPQKDEVGADV